MPAPVWYPVDGLNDCPRVTQKEGKTGASTLGGV
jgi:hypothetical protein